MKVSGHGISIDAPRGWEARIVNRGGAGARLHVATFALRESDGDFGAAATGRMRFGDAFAALVEYVDPAHITPYAGLYAHHRAPAPAAREFAPMALQVTRVGQLGWQHFFTESDRTCCLYAVVKPGSERIEKLVGRLAKVLGTLRIES